MLDPAAKCAPIKPNVKGKPNVTHQKDILRDPEDASDDSQTFLGANQVHNTFFNRAAWIQAQDE